MVSLITFLRTDWNSLWNETQAKGDVDEEFAEMLREYKKPPRAYHNIEHIKSTLLEFKKVKKLLQDPSSIQMALWFHNITYNTKKENNKKESAKRAQHKISEFGLSSNYGQRVSDLIMTTKNYRPSKNPDSKYLIDIDLAIFGQEERELREFENRIRKEYSQYSLSQYRQCRREVLKNFLKRRNIYQTTYFKDNYERKAQENISFLIQKLK